MVRLSRGWVEVAEGEEPEGVCHRHPPQMIVWTDHNTGEQECDSRQPKTEHHDWCGEHQPKPS